MLKVLREGMHVSHSTEGVHHFDPICSSSVLIQSEGRVIIVDPGHIARGEELRELLAKENLGTEDVDLVFLTHHHLDHASNLGAFPKADIFIGNGFVTQKKPEYVVFQDPQLLNVPELKLPSNIKILPTPGHTAESTSLLFEENGLKTICAGDAIREDVLRENAATAMTSREQYFQSVRVIFDAADRIVPGHGRVIEGDLFRELKMLAATLC